MSDGILFFLLICIVYPFISKWVDKKRDQKKASSKRGGSGFGYFIFSNEDKGLNYKDNKDPYLNDDYDEGPHW